MGWMLTFVQIEQTSFLSETCLYKWVRRESNKSEGQTIDIELWFLYIINFYNTTYHSPSSPSKEFQTIIYTSRSVLIFINIDNVFRNKHVDQYIGIDYKWKKWWLKYKGNRSHSRRGIVPRNGSLHSIWKQETSHIRYPDWLNSKSKKINESVFCLIVDIRYI